MEDDIKSSQKAFQTYSNYLTSYCIARPNDVSIDKHKIILRERNGIKKCVDKCTQQRIAEMWPYYKRGKLILEAMNLLPIQDNPKLAIPASFWAPVQAYYAVQGYGLACMILLGQPAPESHTKFLNAMCNHIVKKCYLPFPFNIYCSGNPLDENIESVRFTNLSVDYATVKNTSVLTFSPEIYYNELIAKALATTRVRFIDFRLKQEGKKRAKPGRKRKILSSNEKKDIVNKIHETTIIEFLFRLRIKSNYESPNMYLSFSDEDVLLSFYRNLRCITESLCKSLEVIIDVIMKE